MTEAIPPLPELAISELSRRFIDQEAVDLALKTMYERRPDLFRRMAERDKSGVGDRRDEFRQDFDRFLREELNVRGDLRVQTSIFLEVRRRVRLMYGIPT